MAKLTNSEMATPYVLDFSRRGIVPCNCGDVGMFSASLIPQPWMQDASHILSTNCRCGKYYYSFAKEQVFECKRIARQQ